MMAAYAGTQIPDRILVRLFVYLFNNKCRIANIFHSDIAII